MTHSKTPALLACGLGMHLTWIVCLFYQGTLFFSSGNSSTYYGYYLVSMVALAATLAVFALGAGSVRGRRLFESRRCGWVFATVAFAGSLLADAVGLDGPWGIAAFVASAVLTGVGSGYINILWGHCLVGHRAAPAFAVLALAYMLSTCVYFVIGYLPPVLFAMVIALLPLLSVLCALRLGGASEAEEHREMSESKDDYAAKDLHAFAVRLLAAALLFGGVLGAIQGHLNAVSPDYDVASRPWLLLLFSGVPLMLALGYMLGTRLQSSGTERFVIVYRTALLAMIGALLVSSVLGTPNAVLQVVMLAGYTFFRIVVWTELCQVCRAGGASPTRMFGLGEAALTAALLVGNVVAYALARWTDVSEQGARIVVAIGIALLLVAYLFILTERRIIAVDDIGTAKKDEATHFRFQERVDELARQFGLTKREAEVLRMFVRGRSTARIAEDLYISSGTVTTHLRNVYRKAGVHSRQELLDLLDAKPGGQVEQAG